MMPHVLDVIANHKFQIHVSIIRRSPLVFQRRWIAVTDDMRQMAIVDKPEFDYVQPRPVMVMLEPHPLFLLVSGCFKPRRELHTNEALMIVRG